MPYTMALDATSEREANAELALFRRDPARYLTKAQSAAKLEREIVQLDVATVARFLAHLSSEGRTKRYRENLRTYLSQWAEQLAGRDLREVSTQDLKNALRRWPTGKKEPHHRHQVVLSNGWSTDELADRLSPESFPAKSWYRTRIDSWQADE